ncbi:hypothetical protein RND71_041274 [Anisodus tanguticus]|uniref:Uncharacterized protein n=1 Tax=Anisodus tanguticus TaxID=243964 RepID=A0AAE1QXC8_9SOLA|nr:hypothetical protein RND71_041274 [Anisodus tanguticus]
MQSATSKHLTIRTGRHLLSGGTGADHCSRHEVAFFKQFYGSVTKSDYVVLRIGFIRLLLLVGTKLEHIITELAQEVDERSPVVDETTPVRPSDELFWFNSPTVVLYLIHFILFQNSFEIAFFVWIWMGSRFKKGIFDQQTEGLLREWASGDPKIEWSWKH